jgi:DNA-binding NtrC family response regulator
MPNVPRRTQAGFPQSNLAATGAPCTIVVMEDEESLRWLVRRILVPEGYVMVEAEDGERGLHLVEQHPVGLNLVLTDVQMPEIDGIEVAEVLAAFRPLLPVICMSGEADEAVVEKRLGQTRRPFLVKPFTAGVLLQTVVEALIHSQERLARAQPQLTLPLELVAERDQRSAATVDLVAAVRRLRRRQLRLAPAAARCRNMSRDIVGSSLFEPWTAQDGPP